MAVAPSTTVRDVIRDLTGAGTASVASLAERVGATVAVAGSFASTGGNVRFEVEILDAVSGDLLRALDPVAGPVDSAEVVIGSVAEHTVVAGDSLSAIANQYYGSGAKDKWMAIYEANKELIGDNPSLIRVGQVLKIPKLS